MYYYYGLHYKVDIVLEAVVFGVSEYYNKLTLFSAASSLEQNIPAFDLKTIIIIIIFFISNYRFYLHASVYCKTPSTAAPALIARGRVRSRRLATGGRRSDESQAHPDQLYPLNNNDTCIKFLKSKSSNISC